VISRTQLELIWQTRVRAARHRYEQSMQAFDEAVIESGSLPLPDSSELVRQARKHESCALEQYMRLLRLYTDLVVSGKVPEEPNPEDG